MGWKWGGRTGRGVDRIRSPYNRHWSMGFGRTALLARLKLFISCATLRCRGRIAVSDHRLFTASSSSWRNVGILVKADKLRGQAVLAGHKLHLHEREHRWTSETKNIDNDARLAIGLDANHPGLVWR